MSSRVCAVSLFLLATALGSQEQPRQDQRIAAAGIRLSLPAGAIGVPPALLERELGLVARYRIGELELAVWCWKPAPAKRVEGAQRPELAHSFREFVTVKDSLQCNRTFGKKNVPGPAGDAGPTLGLWTWTDSDASGNDRRWQTEALSIDTDAGGEVGVIACALDSEREALHRMLDGVAASVRLDATAAAPLAGLPAEPARLAVARALATPLQWHPGWEWHAEPGFLLLADVGTGTDDPRRATVHALMRRAAAARAELEQRLAAFEPLAATWPIVRFCGSEALSTYSHAATDDPRSVWAMPEVVMVLPSANPDDPTVLAAAVCAQTILRAIDPDPEPQAIIAPAAFVLDGLASRFGGYVDKTAAGLRQIPLADLHRRVLAETRDLAAAVRALLAIGSWYIEDPAQRRLACAFVDFLLDGSSAADLWQPAWNGVLVRYLQHLQRTRDRAAADAILTALDCDALGAALRSWCERHQRR